MGFYRTNGTEGTYMSPLSHSSYPAHQCQMW
jgi:hypothetical protein